MAKDWNYVEGSAGFQQWWRSGQQLVLCAPGGLPTMDAPITIIRKYDNGDVVVQEAPAVHLDMATLTFERDVADAQLIQQAMFRLLARRVDPMALPPEERLPEPPTQP